MSEGLSVLEQMSRQIVEKKKEASAKLTPVKGERPPVEAPGLPVTGAMFPNDQPREAIEQSIITLERQIAHLQEVVDALSAMVGRQPELTTEITDIARKVAEKKADEAAAERAAIQATESAEAAKFAAEFADQQAAAQAAVFGISEGWKCPEHGKSVERTSPKGRKFLGCPECKEFEKP